MSTTQLRRFVRYEINLIATIAIFNKNSIQCIIRDFCSAGLFLELQPHALHNENLVPQQKIKVLFSVGAENATEDISVDAIIMNTHSNGIGVSFENYSEDAFIALKEESKSNFSVTSASDRRSQGKGSNQVNRRAELQS